LLLPPFDVQAVKEALAGLRIGPLLGGVRGEAPMDVEALADAVVKIGELMADESADVISIDLNPVLLDDAGKGCVVVDAAVFRAG
jgi:acyl-CoA synthetase (NDP forming)